MSALVLKICSEYAKALGLNFPPCVQQEINAIAQYVDLHTVKDLRVEQNGNVVTITCYTEGEQEKVFTVTLPEVNVDTLSALLKGSSSVVVDKSEDGRTIVVRLDQSVIDGINSKITKPETPSEESVVTMFPNGLFDTKPLSEIGGGKLYKHSLYFNAYGVQGVNSGGEITVLVERYSTSDTPLTSNNFQTLFPTNIPVVGTAYLSNGDSICTIRCVPTGQILQAILYCPTDYSQIKSGLSKGVDLTKIADSSNPTAYPIRFNRDTVTPL